MKREDMLNQIKTELKLHLTKHLLISVTKDQIDRLSDFLSNQVLDLVEAKGMLPPRVDSDKAQFLISKYIDPSLLYWDEEFDKEHGTEYTARLERMKQMEGMSLKERIDFINRDKLSDL